MDLTSASNTWFLELWYLTNELQNIGVKSMVNGPWKKTPWLLPQEAAGIVEIVCPSWDMSKLRLTRKALNPVTHDALNECCAAQEI